MLSKGEEENEGGQIFEKQARNKHLQLFFVIRKMFVLIHSGLLSQRSGHLFFLRGTNRYLWNSFGHFAFDVSKTLESRLIIQAPLKLGSYPVGPCHLALHSIAIFVSGCLLDPETRKCVCHPQVQSLKDHSIAMSDLFYMNLLRSCRDIAAAV